jgi:hypothetical protein
MTDFRPHRDATAWATGRAVAVGFLFGWFGVWGTGELEHY